MLDARNHQDLIDAKLTSWGPYARRCWTPDFTENYQETFASDVKLFTLLNQLEFEENDSFEGENGKIILDITRDE